MARIFGLTFLIILALFAYVDSGHAQNHIKSADTTQDGQSQNDIAHLDSEQENIELKFTSSPLDIGVDIGQAPIAFGDLNRDGKIDLVVSKETGFGSGKKERRELEIFLSGSDGIAKGNITRHWLNDFIESGYIPDG